MLHIGVSALGRSVNCVANILIVEKNVGLLLNQTDGRYAGERW
jgi:hypothetical protein